MAGKRSRTKHQPGRNTDTGPWKGPASPKDARPGYAEDLKAATNKWVGSAHVKVKGKPGLGSRKKKTGRITGGGF